MTPKNRKAAPEDKHMADNDKPENSEPNRHDRLRVELAERSYDIVVGRELLGRAGRYLAPVLARPRVVIVSDEAVAALYLARLQSALEEAAISHQAIILPAGEQTKNFIHLENLIGRLLDLKVERNTTLIVLGGGVIGDVAGFAAAVTLRGIPFVQIPTTLLAMVDSSVGGKTGINTGQGKNLVGAFYQPSMVLADTALLDSLPQRELLAGYAEIVKYGLINDAAFFSWLEENGQKVLKRDAGALKYAVITSCAAKAAIVAEDEREAGKRALLNLGHTFGHALEAEAGYGGGLIHGEGVAVGLCLAFDLSERLGLCPPGSAARVRGHLAAVGLPLTLKGPAEALLGHMSRDKKVVDGGLIFILARGIGKAFIAPDVDRKDVLGLLQEHIRGAL
jgi:3-dehydroquinate synthase